ncbi:hypothetical protein [Candidatus Sororendozoicomonas aggregata]|uniref:hypothetical protein n=1 Tax=Candidatus Sororendozoicomonas aggregata TaxID=3073239 RepID=UPI002ED21CE1
MLTHSFGLALVYCDDFNRVVFTTRIDTPCANSVYPRGRNDRRRHLEPHMLSNREGDVIIVKNLVSFG